MNRIFRSLLAASVALVVTGCGQPALIDRTQPNYIKKSDLLEGTWYMKETIVDGPKTPGGMTIGSDGISSEKIRFEIQEGMLIAYRSYEIVPGADPKVDRTNSKLGKVIFQDGRPYRGNPIAAYAISSHFDRQRLYNPATGEQSNVLVEDTSDRPWYEREYMRVSFGKNIIVNSESCLSDKVWDYQCLAGTGRVRQVTAEDALAGDNAPVWERDDKGNVTYFDVTTQAIIDPPSIYYEGYGNLPYCLFNPTVDCESMDIKVRTSFLKTTETETDYEPLTYTDRMMTKFGFFRNEHFSYDKDYYYTLSGRQLFAMRHNIWDRARDAAGKTIPVEKRGLRPIVYYMTANTPEYLKSAASMRLAKKAGRNPLDTIEASWDSVYRRVVAVPRGLEAPKAFDLDTPANNPVPQMFFMCESPVPEGAPKECGKPGTYVRMGDIRYHTMPYVDQNAGGLLGLGPSSYDPETGMVVSANANVYGPGLDTWSGSSLQVMEYLNGDITIEQLVAGADAKGYVFDHLNPSDPRKGNGPAQSAQGLISEPQRAMGSFTAPKDRLEALMRSWVSKGSMPVSREDRKAVIAKILKSNPALENELANLDEVRAAVMNISTNAGFMARLNSDSEFYRTVARNVILGIDPIEDARKAFKSQSSGDVGCYYEYDYNDEDYVGVAKRKKAQLDALVTKFTGEGKTPAQAKKLAKDEIYNEVRREAYRSVGEHEIGHTLGLRHNFIASADALNYQDGYWELRKETIGVDVGGQRVLPVTPQNMLDASKLNQHQVDQGIYEYTYSSIMDYGARVTAQNKGTGKYDAAAMLFAYGGGFEPGWVEVFNQYRTNYDSPNMQVPVDNAGKVFTIRGVQAEIPLTQVEHYTPVSTYYTDKFHYTTLPFHFADANPSFTSMLDQGIQRMQSRSFRKWSEMQAHYDVIEKVLKDYNLNGLGYDVDNNLDDSTRSAFIIKQAMAAEAAATGKPVTSIPVEVPYMFCTDSEVGANLLCNRNDQGADVFEMTTKWLERFNESYIFANFRRDRLVYSPYTVFQGKFGRFLGNVPNVYQHWLFNIYSINRSYQLFLGRNISQEQLDKIYGLGDPIWQNYFTMAVIDSTNMLMQQLTTPQVGYHGRRADGVWEYVPTGDPQNRRRPAAEEASLITDLRKPQNGGYTDVLYMARGSARSMFSIYDTFGYDSFNRINETGHFWDAIAAMEALFASETNFLGVDRGSDALRYSLPYYTTFNRELAPLFNAYWTRDDNYYAGKVGKQADGTGFVVLSNFVKAQDYVSDFVYPPPAPTPVDGSGAPMTMEKIYPNPTWSLRFWAEVLSMANFTANFNQEYANFNQIFRLGSSDNLTPQPGFDVVQFADPYGGGYVYAALKRNGELVSPAAPAMVEKANVYRTKLGNTCPMPGTVVAFNGNLECCTNSTCSTRVPTTLVENKSFKQWEGDVREAVRTLEMMRGLFGIFGRAL